MLNLQIGLNCEKAAKRSVANIQIERKKKSFRIAITELGYLKPGQEVKLYSRPI